MKKLTRNEWEKLEELEELKEERIEQKCENLAITKSIKERFQTAREVFN